MKKCARLSMSLSVLAFTVLLTGCSKNETQPEFVPEVAVITAKFNAVPLETVLTGRLEAARKAEIRARVPGVLQKRLFEEGAQVKAGQKLFVIDDAPYRVALNSAQATFDKASNDYVRMEPLKTAGAISAQEWDAVKQAYAAARSALDSAKINYSYAHVSAPISGRIGKAEVTEGALVGQGVSTLLATIQQTDELYVNMTQSADEVMALRAKLASGNLTNIDEVPVRISLSDGSFYEKEGKLLFVDPTVDESTGQVNLRAQVPNKEGVLFPGLFVKVHIAQAQLPSAVLVPRQAVTLTAQGGVLFVVNSDGSYVQRTVSVAGEQEGNVLVTGGLKEGEQILVEGMTNVKMSQAKKVKTRPFQINNTHLISDESLAPTENAQ